MAMFVKKDEENKISYSVQIYDPQFSHYQIFTQQVCNQQTPVDSKSDMTGSLSLKVIHHNMSLSVL
jgi:hypothetical protein